MRVSEAPRRGDGAEVPRGGKSVRWPCGLEYMRNGGGPNAVLEGRVADADAERGEERG
jgi:hypothetical protein